MDVLALSVLVASVVSDSLQPPWTVACQAPLSMRVKILESSSRSAANACLSEPCLPYL